MSRLLRLRTVLITAIVAVLIGLPRSAYPAPVAFAWWKDLWPHRVQVTVKAVQEERDFPVDVRLNFTNYFKPGEAFDPASIRVVEQDPANGSIVGECPAVFLPTDFNRRSCVPVSRLAVWLANPPQRVRATSETPDHLAKNVLDDTALFGGSIWKGGEQAPPWIIAEDLGSIQTVNCVMIRYPGHGGTQGQPIDAAIEVSDDSPDGLTQGSWHKVGEWKDAANGRLYNVARAAWFAPRKARYARLVITRTVNGPPEIEDFQVRAARFDSASRAEGTVSWIAPGALPANKERVFFLYFDKVGGAAKPAPPESPRFGLLREAEDSVQYLAPTGWSFSPNTLEGASGPKNPNVLTVPVHDQKYIYWDNAGFPVTLPKSGNHTLTLRVRCDPGEHEFEVLLDNQSVRKGKLQFGDGWTLARVPDIPMEAGVHYLEVFMTNGKERPLDFDCLWLTSYPEFHPKAFIVPTIGAGEVRQ